MTDGDRTGSKPGRSDPPEEPAVLEAALDAVITADDAGRILTFN
jgi:hypothetical protein